GKAAKGVIIAGIDGKAGFDGDGGPAAKARLSEPRDIALDADDNIYIADAGNNRIRKIDAQTHVINTIAGNKTGGFTGDGGPATSASLFGPSGVAVDAFGNIFIADTENNAVRRVDGKTNTITTVAGIGTPGFSGDGGTAIMAQLDKPRAVVVNGGGDLYVSD